MCMDLNEFYYEKITSREAEDYAETYAGGLFKDGRNKHMAQFATPWCFMGMTRGIDTIYIKFSITNNSISQILLSLVKRLSYIEILEGEYVVPQTSIIHVDEDLPF